MQVMVRVAGNRWVSDSCERGTAEEAHSYGARQVTGLPVTAVPKVEGVEGLQVVRVSLQVHLAQEFILQDSVVPNLRRDKRMVEGYMEAQEYSLRQVGVRAAGPRSLAQCKLSQEKAHVPD